MRIAALGLFHEANTFSPIDVGWPTLEEAGILRGPQIVDRFSGSRSSMGGFLSAGDQTSGVDIVPVLYCRLTPAGVIADQALERFLELVVEALIDAGPWDAVLLALHGAAVASSISDVDGRMLRTVRAVVGDAIPVGITLDLHANLSQEMILASTVTTTFRTNPHLDAYERAVACLELISATVRGEIRPAQALVKIPVAPHILCQGTADEPLRQVMQAVVQLGQEPRVLSADLALGFPYADTPDLGMGSLVICDGDERAARVHAAGIARLVWEHRHELWTEMISPAQAVSVAKAGPHPVLLLDVGDNVGGGGPADSTFLLDEAVRQRVGGWFQTLYDREAVAACEHAGVGNEVTLLAGGKTDSQHGRMVPITGTVERIADGRFEDPSATHGGDRFFDAGTSVVLKCERDLTLVLTSRRLPNHSLNQLRSLAIDPAARRVIVAKGVIAPRAAFGQVVKRIVAADTPGATRGDFTKLEYARRPRPLFPFERDFDFSP